MTLTDPTGRPGSPARTRVAGRARRARALGAAGAAAGATAAALLPLLLAGAPAAHADDSASASASASASGGTAATQPGTDFLSAAALQPGQQATGSASVGDYLYWSFTASSGQQDTVTATVLLPPGSERHGAEQWRIDLYDGLRRVQSCVRGTPVRSAATTDGSVAVSCTLPRVRDWSENWSNDPLPGTYYVRLTVGQAPEQDLGLPVSAQVELDSSDGPVQPAGASEVVPLTLPTQGPTDGSTAAADGSSAAADGSTTAGDGSSASASASPDGLSGARTVATGFFSGRHSRWWWTGIGAGVCVIAGLAGFTLTRHPRHWFSWNQPPERPAAPYEPPYEQQSYRD